MYEISTGAFVSVLFDGTEYPLERNGFMQLAIVSNKRMSVPCCEFVFHDFSNDVGENITIADNMTMTVREGLSSSKYNTWNFRVFSIRRESARSQIYRVVGYLDVPKWFMEVWKEPIKSVSSKVISTLASHSGLNPVVDSTNDQMIWLPSNKRICQFARETAQHGYASESSCMSLGVTMDKRCLYKDLTLLPTKPEEIFAFGDMPNTKRIFDVSYLTSSGYGNAIGGYKFSAVTQNLNKDGKAEDKINVKRRAQYMMMNKEVKESLQAGRIDIADINIGNTNDKYERGYYQNTRIASTYSVGVELLTDMMTPTSFDLFSPILYDAKEVASAGGEPTTLESFRGVYWVTAKCIFFSQGMRCEKIQAYSNGVNKSTAKSQL